MAALTQFSARLSRLLILLLLLITTSVVLLRYGFGIGSIALQEAMVYCHGAAFSLAFAYTLNQDEHVRVDIFYQRFSTVQKAWVNLFGIVVFALPFCLFLLYSGYRLFDNAWAIKEASSEPGGLPFVYLLKGLIPLSMLLLILELVALLKQAIAQVVRGS